MEFILDLITIDNNNQSHTQLSKVSRTNVIQSIDSSDNSIAVPGFSSMVEHAILDFSQFKHVESIEIGNNCFKSVQTFEIDRLNRLKRLKIGNNSFTQVNQDEWKDSWSEAMKRCNKSKSFHILNCNWLESIQIGENSFSDFGGEFELNNLPQLQSIQIGSIGSKSWNFCCSSLVIRRINITLDI